MTQAEVLNVSVKVDEYVSKYKKLPNKVKVGNYYFSIPEYTYMISKTIQYKYKNKTSSINVKYDVKNPSNPTGSRIKGTIHIKHYFKYSNKLIKFINKNKAASNYVKTNLGKMQYQTTVYTLNKILQWSYDNEGDLPNSVQVIISKNHKMNKKYRLIKEKHFYLLQ